MEIKLNHGKVAIIDEEDAPVVSKYNWFVTDGGYAVSTTNKIRMQRLLMKPPPGFIVDHINRDKLDNRRCNLRIGTKGQNMANTIFSQGPYLKGSRPHKNKWMARVTVNGKMIYLGLYSSELEAHRAYCDKAVEIWGEWVPEELLKDIVAMP